MKHMNSLLLEGVVVDAPIREDDAVIFTVQNKLTDKYAPGPLDEYTEEPIFTVIIRDKIAEACLEYLKPGHPVRLVGALATTKDDTDVRIITSHVEFLTLENRRDHANPV
jgi:single-stranded DNA-binding protein